ncbi:hypothetical protein SUGI_0037050 [Cryptomeria japonica]|nr:hypothetical protein SUGI_0037050 [Cryptomeria japonica]
MVYQEEQITRLKIIGEAISRKMSPDLIRTCTWPPTSETPPQMMEVREDNEACCSKSFEDQRMAAMKECYAESNVHTSFNQLSSDTCELHDAQREHFSSEEIHQEFIKKSSNMDTLSAMLADEYAATIVEHSPICCSSSVTDSPVNVLSDSEEFLWDYNYIALWNFDDVPSMRE